MRQFAARPAWLIAILLAAGQVPPAAATPSCRQAAGDATGPCGPGPVARVVRVAAADGQATDRATLPSAAPGSPAGAASAADEGGTGDGGGTGPQAPGGTEPSGAPDASGEPGDGTGQAPARTDMPPGPPATPQDPARPRTTGAGRIGHFRVYEHPPCAGDRCRATVSDLDRPRSFEARVALGPMHLARPLRESAGAGEIDLLLSGELRHGPGGATLRALHLEGVTPHAPALPAVPRVGPAGQETRGARRHAPAGPAHAPSTRAPSAPDPSTRGLLRA